ncbi:MAG TPA: hypothetical protein PKC43_02680 [Phycisphaerales bacterium]|nr:hypothetical protein [Phycisphaerales bacterium]HMP36332.1 hypothetical protein [Phycisphaerales bacterium]
MPLLLDQPLTEAARRSVEEDRELAVWWGSPIECASAVARLRREGALSAESERAARGLLNTLRGAWFEIRPSEAVREHALRVLRLHALRAADALQLAAALDWIGTPPDGAFLTLDDRLREAALREGFQVPSAQPD